MKTLHLITLILIFSSSLLISCYDSGEKSGLNQIPVEITEQTSIENINQTSTESIPQDSFPGSKTGLVPATSENTGENYAYKFNDKIIISSTYDGTTIKIAANVFIPVAKKTGEIFPVIVFMNSWAMEEHEYVVQAYHFVKKGYIVISYSQRGWGQSEGKASLSGPTDWADFSAVLDWAEDNTPLDIKNIGVSGISLGGGASLHALAHDPRVKTAACLSGYMDMYRSMFSEQTPRLFWAAVLVSSGTFLANLEKDVYKVWQSTLTNTNISWLQGFMAGRSPVDYIDELNRLNKPVYISHNFEDYMFHPEIAMDFFNALTVDHKRIDLNQGTHATGEAPGILGLKNYIYDNVDKWFDYWLKGIDTGIVPNTKKSAIVTMEEKNHLKRVVYNTEDLTLVNNAYVWPARTISKESFYFEPGVASANGKLSCVPGISEGTNSIKSSLSSLLTGTMSGGMILPVLEQFGIPITCKLSSLNRLTTIIYEADDLTSVKQIRGTCLATLNMSLSRKRGQVIIYLYDVNENGIGTFITHGFKTWWDAEAGTVMNVEIPFVLTAYDVPAGHHLAFVLDTSDLNYTKPDLLPYVVTVYNSEKNQSILSIPVDK